MKYSVVFYFDDETDNKIRLMMQLIVNNGVNDYLITNQVPPHITIADFECEDISTVIKSLEAYKEEIRQAYVYWASVGLFNPGVLFLAPVVNQFLLESCERVNQLIKAVPGAENNNYYIPFQWVPHTTIAAKLSSQELEAAFSAAKDNFKAFGGYVTRLAVIQNKPRTDMQVWNLKV